MPEFGHRVKSEGDRILIFDVVRRRFVVLEPEEWVRQNIVMYLIEAMGYPRSLFRIERGVRYNKLAKRFDILILKTDGRAFMLVECKSYRQKLSQKTINQAAVYNQKIDSDFMLISNGLSHFIFEKDRSIQRWKQIRELPIFPK